MQIDNFGTFIEEPQESELYILTEFFKMLGNPTRIHILLLLMEQDACVGDLARQLGIGVLWGENNLQTDESMQRDSGLPPKATPGQ